jgi:hypothetical protein
VAVGSVSACFLFRLSERDTLGKGQPPRSRIDDLIFLRHPGFNKKESYIDTTCDGVFHILEVGLPNLLPSSVQLKEKSVSSKAFGSHAQFDGPQLFHCFESTRSLMCFKTSLWTEFRMCKKGNPFIHNRTFSLEECKNPQISRGHKRRYLGEGQSMWSTLSSLPDISGSPEVSVNQTVALTQPCQMTKFLGAVSFVIEGFSAA